MLLVWCIRKTILYTLCITFYVFWTSINSYGKYRAACMRFGFKAKVISRLLGAHIRYCVWNSAYETYIYAKRVRCRHFNVLLLLYRLGCFSVLVMTASFARFQRGGGSFWLYKNMMWSCVRVCPSARALVFRMSGKQWQSFFSHPWITREDRVSYWIYIRVNLT